MDTTKPTLGQKISKLIKESQYKNPHAFYKAIQEFCGDDAISQKSLYNVISDQKTPSLPTLVQIALVLDTDIFELRKGTTSEPPPKGPSKGVYQYSDSVAMHSLYNGLPFQIEMVELKGVDTITKKDIFNIGVNGPNILNNLIKKNILESKSSRSVSLKIDLNQSKEIIKEIAGPDFEKVWAILKQSLSGRTAEEDDVYKKGSKCMNVVIPTKGEVTLFIKQDDGKYEEVPLKINTAFEFDSGKFHYFENNSKQFSRFLIIKYIDSIKK